MLRKKLHRRHYDESDAVFCLSVTLMELEDWQFSLLKSNSWTISTILMVQLWVKDIWFWFYLYKSYAISSFGSYLVDFLFWWFFCMFILLAFTTRKDGSILSTKFTWGFKSELGHTNLPWVKFESLHGNLVHF